MNRPSSCSPSSGSGGGASNHGRSNGARAPVYMEFDEIFDRGEERVREIRRLSLAEREPAPVVPVVQELGRQVLPWAVPLQRRRATRARAAAAVVAKSHFFAEEAVEAMVQESVAPRRVYPRGAALAQALGQVARRGEDSRVRASAPVRRSEQTDSPRRWRRLMIFEGMQDHTADTIKSLEGFGRVGRRGALGISQQVAQDSPPTIRAPGSEVWFSLESRSADRRRRGVFRDARGAGREGGNRGAIHPPEGHLPRQSAGIAGAHRGSGALKRTDPDEYEHIWGAATTSAARAASIRSSRTSRTPKGTSTSRSRTLGGELLVGMDFNVNPMTP
jgi:hypothetical protein